MDKTAKILLLTSLILFVVFFGNVAFSAARKSEFIGDIPQMLMLLSAVILFVIGILRCEMLVAKNNETIAEE